MWPVRIHTASLPLSLSPLFGTDNLCNLNRPPRHDFYPLRTPRFPLWAPASCRRSCNPYRGQSVSLVSPPRTFPACIAYSYALCLRDPSQHASLKAEIEAQSSSMYATARLWDDGIIKPTETRDVVGLGLGLAARQGGSSASAAPPGSSGNSWNVERSGRTGGFGVYRM